MDKDIINLTVNGKDFLGKKIQGKRGQTVLEVFRDNGIHVPTLCYHPKMPYYGGCRLCIVEIEKMRGLPPSCTTPATDGMVINTHTERVVQVRKTVLELLLAYGDHNCLLCEQTGNCELQDLVYEHGIETVRIKTPFVPKPKDDTNPMIIRDQNKCVLCGRCVRACLHVQVNGVIDVAARGSDSFITTFNHTSLKDSNCVFCGQCVQACPVGALTEKKAKGLGRPWEVQKDPHHLPLLRGGLPAVAACQGRPDRQGHRRRGRRPQPGPALRQGPVRLRLHLLGRPSQDSADQGKRGLPGGLLGRGPGPCGGQIQGDHCQTRPRCHRRRQFARSINEDSYQMQKLFRAVIGTNNIDHCART